MSDTYRQAFPGSIDPEHWKKFGIKSLKHLTKDRTDPWHKIPYKWNSYGGRGRIYRHQQFLNEESRKEINDNL